MAQVKVYDHAGNEFLAPSEEAAEKAVESGQYFFERPLVSVADSLGLQPVNSVVGGSAVAMEKDGVDRYFVYDTNGKKSSMWAVDAKECVKSGQFFWVKPTEPAASEAPESVAGPEAAEESSGQPRTSRRRSAS